jgi:hypothetical protein
MNRSGHALERFGGVLNLRSVEKDNDAANIAKAVPTPSMSLGS